MLNLAFRDLRFPRLGAMRAGGGFSPAILFAGGEPGVWYDPSDLSTLFQDVAGTTPVTASGQPVGLMLDKSGNDLHATQATAAARPTYGIVPETGRRNLLTFTEQFGNAVWVKNGCTVTDQGGGVWRLQAAAGAWTLAQSVPTNNVNNVLSIEVKSNGAGLDNARVLISGVRIAYFFATDEWQRVSVTGLHNNNANANGIWHDGSAPVDILIRLPQFELGSTATAYQKVTTAFDVTEAGVTSLGYLSFDGVDDWMVTPTITPGTDKVQVFAGVRKLSDAATGMILEYGPVIVNGSFNIRAPEDALNNYSFVSFGTSVGIATAGTYTAPISNVIGCLGDISGDRATLRIDGTQVAQSTSNQGTGNYRALPLYIGSRAGTSLRFNGHLHQLITRFGANLEAAKIESTEAYVAGKTAGVDL